MVIGQVIPSGFGSHAAVRRIPPHIRSAIGVSIALHAGVLAYLAYAKFSPPHQEPTLEDPVVQVDMFKLPEPPPPQPVEKPKVVLHTATAQDLSPIKPLPLDPPPRVAP